VGQLRYSFDPARPEPAYLSSIAGKTASLMATSARVGGIVSGAPRPWIDALTEYGRALGMAFQIWDDIRDLVCSEEHLGKPAGHDMVEGTYTLPVLRALEIPGVGDDLRSLLGGQLDPPARDKARDLVLSTSAVLASVVEARRWADQADASLDVLRQGGGAAQVKQLDVLGQVGHRLIDELDIS
jgi:heptaprenyl diphosphate synthase